jgi:ArsR family transcriptional regulator
MKEFIKVMKALSDGNRIKIVKMLQHKPMCVCEIHAVLELAQPTISKHLKVLEEAGLVRFRKNGLWVDYSIADGENPYAASLLESLEGWMEDDPEIDAIVEVLPTVDRNAIRKG